ncbi:MAG: FAD-dependent oxidoreductase, partial [Planctomycetia bacterium]|nr:FAD-dependent oxidoreductase [Planctomycetia bacterium]
VGGGIPGTCAAITAARLGLKVALVQNRPVLGGNGSSEVRVHLNGKVNREPYPNLGNLTYLMGPHGGGNAREAAHYKDDQRAKLVAAEKNIQLFLCTHIVAVDTKNENGRKLISSVVGQ